LRLRSVVLLAWALAAALLAVGCGSGGEDTSTPTIGKAVFIKKANALCKKDQEKLFTDATAALNEIKNSGESPQAAEIELLPTVLAPSLEAKVEEIRALGTPPGDAAQVNKVLDAMQKLADEIKSDPEKYRQELGEFKHPYLPAKEVAEAYGLVECVEPEGAG
jgi:hypothetical protein